jgi:hypothetical protein
MISDVAIQLSTHSRRSLVGCEPGFAAKQDELSPGIGLSQMRFERLSVLDRQMADDFRNAAALTGLRQIKRSVNG